MVSVWEYENRRTRKRRVDTNSPAYDKERERIQREIRESWDDKTRAERAVGDELLSSGWTVPEVPMPDCDNANAEVDYRGYGATKTIGRWRKSTAKTAHAAELCLQMELDESIS